MVQCDFIAQQGRSVHLIDIRQGTELVGPLGYSTLPRFRVLTDNCASSWSGLGAC